MLHVYDDMQLLEEGIYWAGVDGQQEASTDHDPDADYSKVPWTLLRRAPEEQEYEAGFRERKEMLIENFT